MPNLAAVCINWSLYRLSGGAVIIRKKHANPEDLEYLACQQEMDEQLHDRYCQVERMIRKCSSLSLSFPVRGAGHISSVCHGLVVTG